MDTDDFDPQTFLATLKQQNAEDLKQRIVTHAERILQDGNLDQRRIDEIKVFVGPPSES